jgi:hypothetical protein
MRCIILPKFSLDDEVYKFNGFTVNLFINKGFKRIKPLVLEVLEVGIIGEKMNGSRAAFED